MRFNKIILPFILSSVFMSELTSANEMKKVFDYYAQGTPGTYDTSRMKHWMGASFSGRNALREPDLIQAPTISMGGSCKGLDFHASGFGLVTKDEIVQMARGIAQGAPGYFFNMAIGAVCSSCLQNINEFMRKLEQFNQLTKNSCEKFWDKASDMAGLPVDRAGANATGKGGLLDEKMGFLKSWGDKLDEYLADDVPGKCAGGISCSSADEILTENVVYGRIRDVFETSVVTTMFPTSNITTAELAMSLYGTIITQPKKDRPNEIVLNKLPPSANVNPHYLVFKPPSGDTVKFYKCDVVPAVPAKDQKCLEPTAEEDKAFVGLYEFFLEKLNGTATVPGIFTKINAKQNVSATELEFIKAFEMPYLKIAGIDSPALREQMGKRFAYMLAQQFVNDLYRETSLVVLKAFRAETPNTGPVNYKADALVFVEEAEKGLKKMNDEIKTKLEEIDKTLASVSAIEILQNARYGARQ